MRMQYKRRGGLSSTVQPPPNLTCLLCHDPLQMPGSLYTAPEAELEETPTFLTRGEARLLLESRRRFSQGYPPVVRAAAQSAFLEGAWGIAPTSESAIQTVRSRPDTRTLGVQAGRFPLEPIHWHSAGWGFGRRDRIIVPSQRNVGAQVGATLGEEVQVLRSLGITEDDYLWPSIDDLEPPFNVGGKSLFLSLV